MKQWDQAGLALSDQLMASYGPAMQVVGRYRTVQRPDGSEPELDHFLALGRRVVGDAHAFKVDELPLDTFDAQTRFAIFWLRAFGRTTVNKGEAVFHAQSSQMRIEDLRPSVLAEAKGGYELTLEAPPPVTDRAPVIQVARALAAAWPAGGTEAAAQVIADAGLSADDSHLWATVGELVRQLPDSDRVAMALTACQRNRRPIETGARQAVLAGEQLTFDANRRTLVTVTEHWADVLELRPEVVARRGHAEGLQMSLYEAVYQTSDVPYQNATYWCDITEPTTKLVEFMAEICRQLSGGTIEGELLPGGDSLFHLDQGMGGGKSHALVGLWHLARNASDFFASDIGSSVQTVAEQRSGRPLGLSDIRTVVLCADYFSPGVARPEFGPATNLHQRFLWSLFDGNRALYDQHEAAGIDKAALKDAIAAAGRPVLILLDEIMDYAMRLAGPDERETIPTEQAFLNALTGVVNDVPNTVMVVVMIRSDLDEQGYEGPAAEFRSYLSKRLERNGTSVSVNEPQDFGAIIRRRIFSRPVGDRPADSIDELASLWVAASSSAWREHVFDRLPGARQLSGFGDRLGRSYPFHPDLLDLVEHDWTQHAGFQRVRSTVEVFAASAYWWSSEHLAGRWAPALIGVGDIPLHTAADEVLSSGLLHGNERQIVGMRQVAEKDVTSADQTDGQAVLVDRRMIDGRGWEHLQPLPSVRLATALWMYSVAVRAQGRRGATKPELLAAVYVPDEHFTFADADEVFNALTDDEDERGLGALDVIQGGGGGTPARYLLVTQLNKRMFQRNALNRTSPENSYELIWERVHHLATKGSSFDSVLFIEKPDRDTKPLKDIFADVDQRRSNRLVVLDPRRWALLNGRDSSSRARHPSNSRVSSRRDDG